MAAAVRMIVLNNGRKFPILGLGTWQASKEECQTAVRTALDAGYRHIDTAYAYRNEADIGEVLQEYMKAGKLKREDFFITTKLWVTFHQQDRVLVGLEESLKNLQLDYVDLFLMHTPCAFKDTGKGFYPENEDGTPAHLNIPVEETWKGMEKAVALGKAKSIGVSNFNSKQVERICNSCTIKPVTNQVECHAYLNQKRLQDFCKTLNVTLTSYASLGSPGRPSYLKKEAEPVLLEEPLIKELAEKYKKSVGQILLRYLTQRNILVIPKSSTPARIEQNIQIFDFYLSDSEIDRINGLNKDHRYFVMTPGIGHPEYPASEPF